MRLCSLLLLCTLTTPALAAEPALVQFTAADSPASGWKPYTTKEGITVERRPVPGSGFYEHRAVVELPISPAAAADDVWRALRGGDRESSPEADQNHSNTTRHFGHRDQHRLSPL